MYDVCAVLQLQNEIIHLRLEMKSLRNEYDTVRQSLSHSDEEKVVRTLIAMYSRIICIPFCAVVYLLLSYNYHFTNKRFI